MAPTTTCTQVVYPVHTVVHPALSQKTGPHSVNHFVPMTSMQKIKGKWLTGDSISHVITGNAQLNEVSTAQTTDPITGTTVKSC